MRILVCSDSHGMRFNIKDAYDKERPEAVFFLGDGLRDTDILDLPPTVLLCCIKGNCDLYPEETERCFTIENKKLLLTHGHLSGVKQGLWKLDLLAREKNADIILYGHTHRAAETGIDERVYICPGSISRGEYVILDIRGNNAVWQFKCLD